jgi:hypothetical protein
MADYQMPPSFQAALYGQAPQTNPLLQQGQGAVDPAVAHARMLLQMANQSGAPQAPLQQPAGFPQNVDELLGTNKPLSPGMGALQQPAAQPVYATLNGAMANPTMNATDGPYGPMLSSAGGSRVGTQAAGIEELARRLMVGAGGTDQLSPAQALQMAMGQGNTWTNQLLDQQKQALAQQLGMGQLGVSQQQAATEQGRLDLERAKAIYSSSPEQQMNADRVAMQAQGFTPEKIELTIADKKQKGLYGQGLQLPGMNTGAVPAVGPGAAKGVSGGTLEAALGGAAGGANPQGTPPAGEPPSFSQQPPGWWSRVSPLLQDAKGNQLPPDQINIGNILSAINREAPQNFMADPGNVKNALTLAAANIPGGMDAIKAHVTPGAYGKATELLRSGMRRFSGGEAVSAQDALNSAIANSQGWKTGAQGMSPAEAFTPGVQVPILTNRLLEMLGVK